MAGVGGDPICSSKGGPCCFCRKPGNFLLRHSDLRPAWYCGHKCLSARCQLEAVAPKDPFDVAHSAAHLTTNDVQMLGGQEGINETVARIVAIVNHLLRANPGANREELITEVNQRGQLALALAPATNLMPDASTIDLHATLITKVLSVMRAQVTNQALADAQRRAALLAWQGVYAAAVASQLLIPADLVPPAMPEAPAQAPPPPASAAAPAPQPQQLYGGAPNVVLPVPGEPSWQGTGISLLGRVQPLIATNIRTVAKRPQAGDGKFDLLAVGELAIAMMADIGRTSEAASAIGALVRNISSSPAVSLARFRASGVNWASPNQQQLALVAQANTVEGIYPFSGAISALYQLLAFRIISIWLDDAINYTPTIAELIRTDKVISKDSAASNRALALGTRAPKEAEYATKMAQDGEYNWVQTIVDQVRMLRRQGGPNNVLVNIDDRSIYTALQVTLLVNPKRW